MKILFTYAATLAATAYLLRQARKPSRWIGRIFLHAMNASHSSMTDWGLKRTVVKPDGMILDAGCGGGRTVEKLATLASQGKVHGIDYAEGSVRGSRGHSRLLIREGRAMICQASISRLPYPDQTFDLVTAVETQYYWPDLPNDMREILRVLKPGGRLTVIAETYKGGRHDNLKWPVMWLLGCSHLSVEEQRQLFFAAGYVKIEIHENSNKGWICALGSKPELPSAEN